MTRSFRSPLLAVKSKTIFAAISMRAQESEFMPHNDSYSSVVIANDDDILQTIEDIRMTTEEKEKLNVIVIHDDQDRKSTRLNSSHRSLSRMPSSA